MSESPPILGFDAGATAKLVEMRDAGRFTGSVLRISVDETGASFQYQIEVVAEDETREGDAVSDCEGISVYVDPASARRLSGATLEYVDALDGGGFRFDNPNQPALLGNPLAARVQQVLDDEVNPGVAMHGGQVSLVELHGSRAIIRFGGGCQGCGMADVTLKEGVVGAIQRAVPEITEVMDETDHAAGENPYY